ncbi:MAG: hypothetical protein CMI54_04265 [Parcubacteria group bacterium]|nr:hypothetical protein [Parcubacteria group bacterium]
MHLIFGVRGLIQQLNIFEMFMQTQMWVWKREVLTKKGKPHKIPKYDYVQVQGALRRVIGGLYEYVFPEEYLAEVLTMLGIDNNKEGNWNKLHLGKFKPWLLRKLMSNGVKPIPKYEPVLTNRFIEMRGVAIYAIGIKYDKREQKGEWGHFQEML